MNAHDNASTLDSTTHDRLGHPRPRIIARRFACQLPHSRGRLVAVGSRDPSRAADFAAALELATDAGDPLGSYAEVLADPAVDAVYVATVHTTHAAAGLAALRGRQARAVREADGARTGAR